MSVTVTLHAWWVTAYLVVGLMVLPVVVVGAYRSQYDPAPGPFWRWVGRAMWHRPWALPVTVACWPLAVWDVVHR